MKFPTAQVTPAKGLSVQSPPHPAPQVEASSPKLTDEQAILHRSRGNKSLFPHLEKVKKWIWEESCVKLVVHSEFDALIIQQESTQLSGYIENQLGRRLEIFFVVEEEKKPQEPIAGDFEQRVEMFRKVFRGEIIENK